MTTFNRRTILLAIVLIGTTLIGLGLLAIEGVAATLPEPNQELYVYDETKQLSPETKAFILAVNQRYELTEEQPQLAIALVNSLETLTVEQYATELFNKWGIGSAKNNNGVLLLVAPNEGKVRIEVGYGLEANLTDRVTGQMLDETSQLLKEKKIDQAVYAIVTGLVAKVDQLYGYEKAIVSQGSSNQIARPIAGETDKQLAINYQRNQAVLTDRSEWKHFFKLALPGLVVLVLGLKLLIWLVKEFVKSLPENSKKETSSMRPLSPSDHIWEDDGSFSSSSKERSGSSGGTSSSGSSSFGGGSSGGGGSSRSF